MPSYTVHCRLSIELFGKSYYKLHKAIDSAFFFAGSHHRRYFHDYQAVLVFAQVLYPGDDFAVAAGKYHLELDWMFTEDPVLKWRLEKWAKTKVKKKSKSNKKKTKRRKSTSRTNTNLSINRQFTMLLKDVRRLAEISEMAEKMKT